MDKYKIISRTALDYVEIWPFDTFKQALDDLYNDRYMRSAATSYQSYYTSIETNKHPLIKKILYSVK